MQHATTTAVHERLIFALLHQEKDVVRHSVTDEGVVLLEIPAERWCKDLRGIYGLTVSGEELAQALDEIGEQYGVVTLVWSAFGDIISAGKEELCSCECDCDLTPEEIHAALCHLAAL